MDPKTANITGSHLAYIFDRMHDSDVQNTNTNANLLTEEKTKGGHQYQSIPRVGTSTNLYLGWALGWSVEFFFDRTEQVN